MTAVRAKLMRIPIVNRIPSLAPHNEGSEMEASLLEEGEKYWRWADVPEARVGCPPGLEVFQDATELWLLQHKRLKDELKLVDAKTKFSIRDGEKQLLYFVEERSSAEDRVCWGKDRQFTLLGKNEALEDVLSFHRPWKSSAALFSWLNTEKTGWTIEVAARGRPIGAVKQVNSGLHKRFDLVDENNKVVLHVKGPLIEGRLWTEDVDFELFEADRKTRSGKISLKWGGVGRDLLDAQRFRVRTSASVSAQGRLLALAATFLIRFMCTDKI